MHQSMAHQHDCYGRGLTCPHEMRSLVHNAHLSTSVLTCTHGMRSLVHIHAFMGRETYSSTGGVGGMVTYLGLAHILILVYGWGGWGGWDDNVPWTCTHTDTCLRLGGWGGWDDNVPWTCTHTDTCLRVGWVGWDDNVPWTCTHTSLRVGWVGWDDNVPWTCTHTSLQQAQLCEVSSGCSNNTQHLLWLSQVDNL